MNRELGRKNRRTRRLGAGQSYCTMFTSSAVSTITAEARTHESAIRLPSSRAAAKSPFSYPSRPVAHRIACSSPRPARSPTNRRRRPRISRRPSAVPQHVEAAGVVSAVRSRACNSPRRKKGGGRTTIAREHRDVAGAFTGPFSRLDSFLTL